MGVKFFCHGGFKERQNLSAAIVNLTLNITVDLYIYNLFVVGKFMKIWERKCGKVGPMPETM